MTGPKTITTLSWSTSRGRSWLVGGCRKGWPGGRSCTPWSRNTCRIRVMTPDPALQVMVGIETERGPWVASLVAAGYTVYAVNPMSAARYRERHSTSGAKSDAADAHLLAEIVRVDRAHHRAVAGDSAPAEGIKLAARAHQNLVWERTRHVMRVRSALREFFPAALQAFPELDAADTLALLAAAPHPDTAARLPRRTV